MPEEQLKIAVFVDFDNIQIGVRSTLSQEFDVAAVLEALKERGEVVSKIAYGDWKRHGTASRKMSEQAVQMVQRYRTPLPAATRTGPTSTWPWTRWRWLLPGPTSTPMQS